VGKVELVEGFGGLIRITMPGIDAPVFVSGSSIYQITPCSEDYAREHARLFVQGSTYQASHLSILLPAAEAAPQLPPRVVTPLPAFPDGDDIDDEPFLRDDEQEDDSGDDDRDAAIRWAREWVAEGNFVVLDTETTGIDNRRDVPVQIAIVDAEGNTLLDTLVHPGTVPISSGALAVHGITPDMMIGAPTWDDVFPQLKAACKDKQVIIYNFEFDYAMICNAVRSLIYTNVPFDYGLDEGCAMLKYAQFHGEWNSYHSNYKWQRLDTACSVMDIDTAALDAPAHSAKGDALRTLALIKAMAAAQLSSERRAAAIDIDSIPY
jgi:DNA polymerase III subunit epsilon